MGSSEIIRDEPGPNLHEMAQKLVTDYFPVGSSEIIRDEAGPNPHEMVQNQVWTKTAKNDVRRFVMFYM